MSITWIISRRSFFYFTILINSPAYFSLLVHPVSVMCSRSDLVHLVDSYSQLSDTKRTHQQGMLSGLTARLEACLKFSSAGIHHKHRHIGLGERTRGERLDPRASVSAEASEARAFKNQTKTQLTGYFNRWILF